MKLFGETRAVLGESMERKSASDEANQENQVEIPKSHIVDGRSVQVVLEDLHILFTHVAWIVLP